MQNATKSQAQNSISKPHILPPLCATEPGHLCCSFHTRNTATTAIWTALQLNLAGQLQWRVACYNRATREKSVHMSPILLYLSCCKHGIQPTHPAQQSDCNCTPRFQLWAWILTANGLLQRQKSLLRVVCGCGLTYSRASTKQGCGLMV